MRAIRDSVRLQRGCDYCADMIKPNRDGGKYTPRQCPYDECPYHELDDIEKYAEYLQKTDNDGLIKALEDMGKE